MLDGGDLADGSPYLVMEYLEGETLASRLQRAPRPSIDEGVGILAQILSALSATHARGIIHRDLKSDNVFLVTHPAGLPWVKVLDFGLSKVLPRPGDAVSGTLLTRTGVVLGTPSYMSPEQASSQDLDARTDLYSAGVIAYEALMGERPYRSRHPTYLLLEMKSRAPARLSAGRPDAPEALEHIVLRLMALRREDRFATAADALAMLAAAGLIRAGR